MNRSGEIGQLPLRNKRIFQYNNYWYYHTREGIDVGPFDTCTEAVEGVSRFIDFITHAEPSVKQALARYSKGMRKIA